MLDVRTVLGNEQGVSNTIKTEFEDFFLCSNNNLERQLAPWFDDSDKERKLAAYLVGQLMAKLEAMATKIIIGRYPRTRQWRGSPSHKVCHTPRQDPRVIGDGTTTVDPVFRAVTHTGNARDL